MHCKYAVKLATMGDSANHEACVAVGKATTEKPRRRFALSMGAFQFVVIIAFVDDNKISSYSFKDVHQQTAHCMVPWCRNYFL